MRHLTTVFIITIAILLLVSTVACNGGETEEADSDTKPTVETDEKVIITIGNLSDMTGPASKGMEQIHVALDDLVEYYNEQNLIPGVELKVISYDGQLDPAKDIPGYEWLRGRGADLIYTPVPGSPVTLKPRADNDNFVVFAASATYDEILPSGYVFNLGIVPQHEAHIILQWIAENDWDYHIQGPAKVGGAGWNDAYTNAFFGAMEEYAKAHPDQFEWVGGHLTNFSFAWGPEVEALKDCDYVFPCTVPITFIREYRDAGHTAKFIATDPHLAVLGTIYDANLWDEIDGTLFVRSSLWWNDEGELVDLTQQLLYENHADDAEGIIRTGVGYKAMPQLYQMLDIIAKAVEAVGPENFDAQALYEAAKSWSLTVDGVPRYSFSETKRHAVDNYAIYEARAAEEDVFRVGSEWYPVVLAP